MKRKVFTKHMINWLLMLIIFNFMKTTPVLAQEITFTGEELLGKPTDTSITINIVPDETINYYYEYGTEPGMYTSQTTFTHATGGQPNEMEITGLIPNTQYYYRMRYQVPGGSWEERNEHSFWTQRAKGSTFTFTISSDTHAQLNAVFERAMQNIIDEQPDFHIDLGDTFMGDTVNSGDLTSQSEVDDAYLAYRDPNLFGAIGSSIPIFLTAGNHEEEEGWNLDDMPFSQGLASIQARKAYFPTPIDNGFYSGNINPLEAIDETVYGDKYREDYYAWEWGDALFIVLDEYQYTMNLPYLPGTAGENFDDVMDGDQWSWTLGAQQFNWFKDTLENSNAKYKFVFSHNMLGGITRPIVGVNAGYVRGGAEAAPYFEWGGHDAEGNFVFNDHRDPAEFGTVPIHQLMIANGVSAYFHGHDHMYVYEKRDNIVYQEVPSTSGFGDRGFPGVYSETDPDLPGEYQTIKILPNAGHLQVSVSPAQAVVSYIRSDQVEPPYTYTIQPVEEPLHPIANAGTDQIVSANSLVTLDGSGSSDPNAGNALTYSWQQTGEPSVLISDAAAISPTFTAPSIATVLTFTLTVSNTSGLSASDLVVITVQPKAVNQAPIATSDNYTMAATMPLHVVTPGILSNDNDPDDDLLTAVLDTDVPIGTLELSADGSFIYTAPQRYTGTVTFDYHANDGIVDSNIVQVMITIQDEADGFFIYLPLIDEN